MSGVDDIERRLSADPHMPAGHLERVMDRVERAERARGALVSLPAPMPWWISILFDPATVLALVLAAVLVGWGPALYDAMQPLFHGQVRPPGVVPIAAGWWTDPAVLIAAGFAAMPFLFWIGRRTYTAFQRIAVEIAVPRARRAR